jgi:hypothetical protein
MPKRKLTLYVQNPRKTKQEEEEEECCSDNATKMINSLA